MTRTRSSLEPLTAEQVVRAYCLGAFPMARSRRSPTVEWYSPDPRAILPLEAEAFHIPRSLRRRLRRGPFHITHDRAFERVIRACAEPRPTSPETWINEPIIRVYTQLHHAGLAHSVEAWAAVDEVELIGGGDGDDGGAACVDEHGRRLVGGIYGVALGGAFFGESMFSRVTDASKVCLVRLVEHLRARAFVLFDVQFVNPHLEQFGVQTMRREAYLQRLHDALAMEVTW